MWRPFEDGATVGRRGSEDGIIHRDEEHDAGARITLERGCSHGVPFAVTCGIYGWFFHTRLLGSEAEAEFPAMRDGLAAILDIIPAPTTRRPTPRSLRSARPSESSYHSSPELTAPNKSLERTGLRRAADRWPLPALEEATEDRWG